MFNGEKFPKSYCAQADSRETGAKGEDARIDNEVEQSTALLLVGLYCHLEAT